MEKNKQPQNLMQDKLPLDPFDADAAQTQPDPQSEMVTITVDGQALTLTMEQLVQAAIAGLSKRGEMLRLAGASSQVPNGQVYANFISAYPDVKPGDIPQEVWQDAQTEGSLVSAYRKYEIALLREKLRALEQNADNRKQAVGSAAGDGHPVQIDPVIAALRA